MRILVTGGLGFIGSHVVEAALIEGHEVRVLDCRTLDEAAALPGCGDLRQVFAGRSGTTQRGDVEVALGDVRDPDAVFAGLAGVDAVIHLAAKVGLGDGVSDAAEYVSNNDLGAATLVAAMSHTAIDRLVLASSMVVYGGGLGECPEHGEVVPPPRLELDLQAGEFESNCPICDSELAPLLVDEDAPLRPANVYAATKLAQEHLVDAWARATGGTAAALRFHNVYGRRLPRDTPYAGVAALFVSMLQEGQAPRVFEDGAQRRDFVQVRDVARATVTALSLTAPGTSRAFNVGSGTPRTVLAMARSLAAAARGPEPVVTGQYRLGDVRHITASSRRASNELGWQASEDFDRGMAEL